MDGLKYISDSIKGTEREENKDRIFVAQQDGSLLAILFDGISSAEGANAGIDVAIEFAKTNYQRIKLTTGGYGLADLMFDVHRKIVESPISSPFSTYSAAYVPQGDTAAVFSNLGDSRIYEVTSQYIKQLSHDDNLVHNRSVVTRYLGMVNLERSGVTDFPLDIKDKRILLCSDGFYSILEQNLSRFHEVLNFKRPSDIEKALSQEIRSKNLDDSSYILMFNE